jgi:hypothetical protein
VVKKRANVIPSGDFIEMFCDRIHSARLEMGFGTGRLGTLNSQTWK